MRWRDVRILYLKELRTAVRERSIVINAVLVPIFLYPVLLWLMFSAFTFVEGLAEGFESRVAVLGDSTRAAPLVDSLRASENVRVVDEIEALAVAESAIQEGELDAVLELTSPSETEAGAGNVVVRIHYDRAEERSRRARDRLEGAVDAFRADWLRAESESRGITPEERLQFGLQQRNIASDRDVGTRVMAQMIPLFLAFMVALGCLIPAVDSTAGERERSTWETTLTLAAGRPSVVAAKYLYVATVGIVAGILNVIAITVSMGAVIRPLLSQNGAGFAFTLPLAAVPVLIVGAIGLALFFAAGMMILAAFARTFKDGQAMVSPVYYLLIIPLLMGDQSGQHLTPLVAAIPLANVTTMMRDAIQGVFLWPLIAEVVVVGSLTILAILFLARQVLRFEDFLVGSHEGSFWRFAKEKLT